MAIGQESSGNNDSAESTAEQEKPLRESLADASVLLWYATREGKQVSEETIGDIVLAQSSLSGGRRDPEVEGRFWVALRALAAAVQPASVDSILATYGYPFGDYNKTGKHRLVDAASTKRAYNIGSIVVLSMLLIVQIYWFVGTTFRNDLELHRTELDQIAGSLREMNLAARAGREYIKIKEQQIPNPNNNQLLFDKSAQFTFGLTKEIEALKQEQDRVGLEYANVTRRASRVMLMLKSDTAMLGWWDVFSDLVVASPGTAETDEVSGKEISPAGATYTGDTWTKYWALDPDGDVEFQNKVIAIENALVENHLKAEVPLLSSKSTLAILSQYVLPLLYGLLGSLAYILRTLSTEIQNVTFTRGSEIRYSLRWPLGMLGGVTVGLFFDPADLSGLAMITPLGLAFLAGYGVELLFTGLDRLVRAFTSEDADRPKAT